MQVDEYFITEHAAEYRQGILPHVLMGVLSNTVIIQIFTE